MKKITLLLLATLAVLQAIAQKLPNVQQVSLRAPANVKIDGKTTEWDQNFPAYNKSTDVYYTLSNDEKNLYLVIQTPLQDVINKISGGGITFTAKGKNGNKEANLRITYPAINKKETVLFVITPQKGTRPDTSAKAAESFMKSNNKKLNEYFKWIKVAGIKGSDTLSIYNETGILAAAGFNLQKALTLELSIPLTTLKNNVGSNNTIGYEITVHGGKPFSPAYPIKGDPASEAGAAYSNKIFEQMNAKLTAETGFSGEYTLAK